MGRKLLPVRPVIHPQSAFFVDDAGETPGSTGTRKVYFRIPLNDHVAAAHRGKPLVKAIHFVSPLGGVPVASGGVKAMSVDSCVKTRSDSIKTSAFDPKSARPDATIRQTPPSRPSPAWSSISRNRSIVSPMPSS